MKPMNVTSALIDNNVIQTVKANNHSNNHSVFNLYLLLCPLGGSVQL